MPWQITFDADKVLDRAMQTFWACGYEATSMQDLVDRTGINRGSLYATFGDKRALFLSALRMYDDKVRRKMLEDFEARYAPRDAIRAVFRAFSDNVSARGGNRGCFLTNTALELAAHDREVRKIVANGQEEVQAFFARMLNKGKAQREIPENVQTQETARGLLASLLGLIVLTRSRPEPTLLRAIVDDAMRRLE